jgi:hypothetical protein
VEIFGNREERIELAKMYITPDGEAFDESNNLLSLTSEDMQTQKEIESYISPIQANSKEIIIPGRKRR